MTAMTEPVAVAVAAVAAKPSFKALKAAADPGVRVVKPLQARKIHLAAHVRNTWVVYAGDDVLPTDLEAPAMWAAAQGFTMFDRVEVIQPRRIIDCIVTDAGPGFTTVKVLHVHDIPARQAGMLRQIPPGYDIAQGKPDESPYRVMRLKDGMELSKGVHLDTYEAALRWLLDLAVFQKS